MFGIFNYSDERRFAAELVRQIAASLKPESLQGTGFNELSVNKITRLLERIYIDAGRHFEKRKLGVIRRSVFANAFKWGLREKGYPDNFIDIATEGLVMEMAKRPK